MATFIGSVSGGVVERRKWLHSLGLGIGFGRPPIRRQYSVLLNE